ACCAARRALPSFPTRRSSDLCEQRDGLPPVAVQRAAELTGVAFRGRDVVVIGDTPNDVTCGRALGVTAVAVATGRHDQETLRARSEEHTSELQSRENLVCRLL